MCCFTKSTVFAFTLWHLLHMQDAQAPEMKHDQKCQPKCQIAQLLTSEVFTHLLAPKQPLLPAQLSHVQ